MQRDVFSDDEDMEAGAFDVEKEELRRSVLQLAACYGRNTYLPMCVYYPSSRLAKKEDLEAMEEERRHEEEKRRRKKEKEKRGNY